MYGRWKTAQAILACLSEAGTKAEELVVRSRPSHVCTADRLRLVHAIGAAIAPTPVACTDATRQNVRDSVASLQVLRLRHLPDYFES